MWGEWGKMGRTTVITVTHGPNFAYLHEGAAMVTGLLLGVLVDELVQEVGQ